MPRSSASRKPSSSPRIAATARARIEPRVNDLLTGLEAVGEVMALTRNESAVHEKIGVYDKVVTGDHNAMVLGAEIDLRIFPKIWAHGFAVEKRDGDEIRRSLQFFDAAGEAVHKVHLRAGSNLYAYQTAGRRAGVRRPVARPSTLDSASRRAPRRATTASPASTICASAGAG